MTHYYLDTSALVKRYVTETGTIWITTLYKDLTNNLYTNPISSVEAIAAFHLRVRTGTLLATEATRISQQVRKEFQARYRFVSLSTEVINIGLDLAEQYPLRGYDAVQLASALFLNRLRVAESFLPIIFLSADERVNKVAVAEGLTVENPNDH